MCLALGSGVASSVSVAMVDVQTRLADLREEAYAKVLKCLPYPRQWVRMSGNQVSCQSVLVESMLCCAIPYCTPLRVTCVVNMAIFALWLTCATHSVANHDQGMPA